MTETIGELAGSGPRLMQRLRSLRLPRFGGRHLPVAVPAAFLVLWVVVTVFAPLAAPFSPTDVSASAKLLAPSASHLFGTDNLGRDVFSRVLYGARWTLFSGLACVLISSVGGVCLGLLGGYFPGWARTVIMRFIDIIMSFPGLILAMGISVALGPGFGSAIIAVAIAGVPAFARLSYVLTVSLKEREYVEASLVGGAGHLPVVFQHILPNAIGPILVQAAIEFRSAILFTSALSFIGLGAQPPSSEWGLMVSDGRLYLTSGQWWVSFFPGLAIASVVLAMSIMADSIRDLVDPRLSRSR